MTRQSSTSLNKVCHPLAMVGRWTATGLPYRWPVSNRSALIRRSSYDCRRLSHVDRHLSATVTDRPTTSFRRPLQFLPPVAHWSYDWSYTSHRLVTDHNECDCNIFMGPMVADGLWWSATFLVVSGRQPVIPPVWLGLKWEFGLILIRMFGNYPGHINIYNMPNLPLHCLVLILQWSWPCTNPVKMSKLY